MATTLSTQIFYYFFIFIFLNKSENKLCEYVKNFTIKILL